MKIYYFGVKSSNEKGHFFFKPGFVTWSFNETDEKVKSLVYPQIDTGYCPKTENYEEQGLVKITYEKGLTIFSFWDRSGDGRGGCNSSFIAIGKHTFDEMLEAAKECFPTIFERFDFEIREYQPITV